MYRYPLIFAVVIILLIIGAFSLLGGNKAPKSNTLTSQAAVQPLVAYANTNAQVSMLVDGQVNGDDIHRAIRVTVGQNQRVLDIIQGYSGNVISHQSFYNSQDAYNVFLRAINTGGFSLPLKNSKAPSDERGQCPIGFRYIFTLNQNGKDLSRLWSSTCGTSVGTFGGNTQLERSLFQSQIPKYEELVGNVAL